MLLEGLLKYLSKIEKILIENVLWVVEAMMRSRSANTSQVALALSQLKKMPEFREPADKLIANIKAGDRLATRLKN